MVGSWIVYLILECTITKAINVGWTTDYRPIKQ